MRDDVVAESRRRVSPGGVNAAMAGDAAHEYDRTIQAVLREHTGGRYADMQRAAGRIPTAVLTRRHGSDDIANTQLLTTDEKKIREFLDRSPFFCSTPIKLQVRARPDSAVVLRSGTVLPIQVHKSQETGQIMNLMFEWVDEGSVLKVDMPVVFKGEDACPDLKKDLDVGDVVLVRDTGVHPPLKLLSEIDNKPANL